MSAPTLSVIATDVDRRVRNVESIQSRLPGSAFWTESVSPLLQHRKTYLQTIKTSIASVRTHMQTKA